MPDTILSDIQHVLDTFEEEHGYGPDTLELDYATRRRALEEAALRSRPYFPEIFGKAITLFGLPVVAIRSDVPHIKGTRNA